MTIAAILVAAGRGTRVGAGAPKQYRDLDGRPVLWHSLGAMLTDGLIDQAVVVIHPDDMALYQSVVAALAPALAAKLTPPAFGGASRQASVHAGLEALAAMAETAEVVLVHDAARPFVSPALINRAITAARVHGAAVPGLLVTDTIKQVDAAGFVHATHERAALRAIQTPQAFRLAPILAAHRRAAALPGDAPDFTDDGAIAEWAGLPVAVFEGETGNTKLTIAADFRPSDRRQLTQETGPMTDATATLIPRVGIGYDVHAFTEGDHVWLGGIKVPHDMGVRAHSDGDVVLHALTDAVLGALADGDIGTHFPPSDPAWAGASSDCFLAYAIAKVRARGGIVDHLDATVVCERPKIGPVREAIRARIAAIAGIDIADVSIKATTSEQLGFTGRREGIAAQAAASIRLPKQAQVSIQPEASSL